MDFVRDYMRALLAKEIDAAAELQKQKSQVVYQQYCAGGTMHRGYYCPSLTEDLWLGNTKRGRLCKKRPSEERLSHALLKGVYLVRYRSDVGCGDR